jgi:hypothetical protein
MDDAAKTAMATFEAELAAATARVASEPDHPAAHVQLAQAWYHGGQPEKALASIQRALSLNARWAPAHFHAAQILTDLGEWEAAQRTLDAAVALAPDWSTAHYMRGLQRLTAGDWRPGWEEHEWRWRIPEYPTLTPPPDTPRWQGGPLTGVHLLVDAEQGHGDTVQFVRFVPELVRRGARVTLRVHPALVSLLQGNLPAAVISIHDPAPRHDQHAHLMSLPFLLGVDRETAFGSGAYLHAAPPDDEAGRRLDQLLVADGRPLVGVVWSGRSAHPLNARRSVPLAEIGRLARAHPHLRFVSLQRFIDEPGGGTVPTWLVDATACCHDFSGLAQTMVRLDLLLSACTAPAHLGGALGVPTWVLLGHAPDWRWMRDRADSPWYGSVRLFRQTRPFDWSTVTEAVSAALAHRFPQPVA